MMHFYGLELDEKWDTLFFVQDGQWAEEKCENKECLMCFLRPETAYTNLIKMPV